MSEENIKSENLESENTESSHVIDLIDEDGNTVPFEHLDTVKLDDSEYIICIPYDDEEEEVTEIVIFEIAKDEDPENCLRQVTDEEILDKVYEKFKKRNKDKFDFDN